MRAVVLLSCLAACGRLGFGDRPTPDAAESGIYEQRIDIAGSLIPSTLSDFPVYVHLEPLIPTAQIPRLEFLDSTDTALSYEIEASSPNAYELWIRVPLIAGDTSIRVRYGAITAGADDPTDVWDTHFVGVWHLGDTRDSTANHNDGVFTTVTATPGIVAGAQAMTHGWMTVPDAPSIQSLTSADGLTLELWTNVAVAPAAQYTLITRQTDTNGNDDFRLGVGAGPKVHSEFTVDPFQVNTAFNLGLVAIGAWQLLAVTRLAATGAVENSIDGQSGGTGNAPGALHVDANSLVFGADCNSCGATPNDDFYMGAMDEARISNVVRSLDWMRAEYLNMTGALVTVH